MHQRQRLGSDGEQLAADHLTRAGLLVRDRNWRTSVEGVRGELDIIALDGPTLALIEVRTRRGTSAGTAAESVGRMKRLQLRRLAALYLQAHPHTGPVRGDVVAIAVAGDVGDPMTVVQHLRGVW